MTNPIPPEYMEAIAAEKDELERRYAALKAELERPRQKRERP